MSAMTTGPDAEYAAFLAEGRFRLQRAPDGSYVFYPRVAQPGTGAPLTWCDASGLGEVYATTVVRRRPPEPSYNVALIDLEEGVRMMSRVEGIPADAVRIGMKVKAKITPDGDGHAVIFEPAS